MSPEALQTELASEQNLGQSRQTLLDALIIYNIAIADLERAKGTLLYYNNVALDEN